MSYDKDIDILISLAVQLEADKNLYMVLSMLAHVRPKSENLLPDMKGCFVFLAFVCANYLNHRRIFLWERDVGKLSCFLVSVVKLIIS
jgi:hypothetical protein